MFKVMIGEVVMMVQYDEIWLMEIVVVVTYVLMQILIAEFFLTYMKLVIHQIETSQSICKSIEWFLYDRNLNMKWSNEIHEIIQEGIKQTCKTIYSRVLFKFQRISKRNFGVLHWHSFSSKVV